MCSIIHHRPGSLRKKIQGEISNICFGVQNHVTDNVQNKRSKSKTRHLQNFHPWYPCYLFILFFGDDLQYIYKHVSCSLFTKNTDYAFFSVFCEMCCLDSKERENPNHQVQWYDSRLFLTIVGCVPTIFSNQPSLQCIGIENCTEKGISTKMCQRWVYKWAKDRKSSKITCLRGAYMRWNRKLQQQKENLCNYVYLYIYLYIYK